MHFPNICEFCHDANSNGAYRNVVVERYDHSFIISDKSPISDQHFLLIPNEHVTSLANASNETRLEVVSKVLEFQKRASELSKIVIASEHGTGVPSGPSSACIEHAHIHIVVVDADRTAEKLRDIYIVNGGEVFSSVRPSDANALVKFQRSPYNLLWCDPQNILIWPEITGFWPQFFRGALCDALDRPKVDRRRTWQLSVNVEQAIRNLRGSKLFSQIVIDDWETAETVKKLVRDGVPRDIEREGRNAVYSHISEWDRRDYLLQKLSEESAELVADPSIEEAADVYEVMVAIFEQTGYKISDVSEAAKVKKEKFGSFSSGIYLDMMTK